MSRCFPKSRKHAVTQSVAGGWAGSCGTSTENPGLSHSMPTLGTDHSSLTHPYSLA